MCAVTKTGILVKGLRAAGLFPVPESPETMYQSVAWYWKKLNSIGAEYKAYEPWGKIYGDTTSSHHHSLCTFERCFGGFGVLYKAGNVLERYTHSEVSAYLQSVSLSLNIRTCNADRSRATS